SRQGNGSSQRIRGLDESAIESEGLKNDTRFWPGKSTEPGDSMLTWSTDDDSYSFVRPGRPILCKKASLCFRREALDFSRASRSCCEYCGCASQTRFCSWRPVGPSPPE